MWNGDVKSYRAGYVYIIDDVEGTPGVAVMGLMKTDLHSHNCGVIRKFFTEYTDFTVEGVSFPKRAAEDEFFKYWTQQLSTKTSEDLIIIYFHGNAGNEDEDYWWTFRGGPKRGIDAHGFFELLCNSAPDSMLLLDCWLHTRISKKWKRTTGNTEIILRGQEMQDEKGRREQHEKDFTDALVWNLKEYIDALSSGLLDNHKALRSIPQVMARDQDMHTNPQRIWLDRTSAGASKVVVRFKMDPDLIRSAGKIEFFAHQIQGISQEAKNVEKFSDEGLADMDEMNNNGEVGDEHGNDEGLADMDEATNEGEVGGEHGNDELPMNMGETIARGETAKGIETDNGSELDQLFVDL